MHHYIKLLFVLFFVIIASHTNSYAQTTEKSKPVRTGVMKKISDGSPTVKSNEKSVMKKVEPKPDVAAKKSDTNKKKTEEKAVMKKESSAKPKPDKTAKKETKTTKQAEKPVKKVQKKDAKKK